MKLGLSIFPFAILASSCKPAPAPAPLDPSVRGWGEIVEAGCALDDPGGPDALFKEAQLGTDYAICLLDGGTVQACDVPCSLDSDFMKKEKPTLR